MKLIQMFSAVIPLLISFSGYTQWIEIPIDSTDHFQSTSFTSDNTGYGLVNGTGGWNNLSIQKTTDGGFTWDSISFPYSGEIHAIHFFEEGKGVVVARDMSNHTVPVKVYQTLNDGANWQDISPDSTLAGMGSSSVQFLDQNVGFMATGRKLYTTIDGGSSWDDFEFTVTIMSLNFIDANHGTLGGFDETFGYRGSMHSTSDGGQSWRHTYLTDWNTVVGKIIQFDENNVYAGPVKWGANFQHKFYKSSDNGTTWDTVSAPNNWPSSSMTDIDFRNQQVGMTSIRVGLKTYVFRTMDGGNNWIFQDSLNSVSSSDLRLTHSTGYLVGEVGRIYKFNEPVSINELKETELSLYPNPIGSEQTLYWDKEAIYNRVNIFDMNGKLVKQQILAPTETSITLTNLQNGIYLIHFLGENMTSHQKIVVSQ